MRKQQIIQVKFQRKRRSNIQFDKKQNQINYITMRMRVKSESGGSTLISYVYLGINYENVRNFQSHFISTQNPKCHYFCWNDFQNSIDFLNFLCYRRLTYYVHSLFHLSYLLFDHLQKSKTTPLFEWCLALFLTLGFYTK